MDQAEKHIENSDEFKSLKVNKGVEQPQSLNNSAIEKFKSKRKSLLSEEEYFNGIVEGNLSLLSQAITIIESQKKEHQILAKKIINLCLPKAHNSIRIGITGVPGVGKSSFIESFGSLLADMGYKVAVLAVDPSSEISGGSILGDKTRMEVLSNKPNVFIRPSPSSGSLGGVARKSRETIFLCEAAGYDVILIETVGVGQSEIAVHSMVDFFLLLMLGGAGDELQGIKRGIMEMADCIAITKADGSNITKAKLAKAEYENALHLFPPTPSGWIPKAVTCSAVEKLGIEDIWNIITHYSDHTKSNGFFEEKRKKQAKYWMLETIEQELKKAFYSNSNIKSQWTQYEEKLYKGEISPFDAADQLYQIFKENQE